MSERFPGISSFGKLAIVAVLLTFVTGTSASLAEVTLLACQISKVGGVDIQEEPVSDLQIDLENDVFEWGAQSYTIKGLTTRVAHPVPWTQVCLTRRA